MLLGIINISPAELKVKTLDTSCFRCLQDNEWDFERAAQIFAGLKVLQHSSLNNVDS